MEIIKGKDKGKIVKIIQFCNDWFTADNGKVYSVFQIQLTSEERFKVANDNNTGMMFDRFRLLNDGRFIKKE